MSISAQLQMGYRPEVHEIFGIAKYTLAGPEITAYCLLTNMATDSARYIHRFVSPILHHQLGHSSHLRNHFPRHDHIRYLHQQTHQSFFSRNRLSNISHASSLSKKVALTPSPLFSRMRVVW
ncbi:uncharacterized protein BCR38DRAFT_441651 [Pseudomassariella vexata]|uniref:Uncharacterized protein n=1 Tax=Pseudomassariella vexata TaxID=1141098 RepID=A0A1Y2DMT0_9PEZI|nr:uncharacterized protein BCR38DRAFT_441651 [Pseudomassariella vexata]ORY60598.1 hypothetical protein BCR38DRAFT_441651 [Pseudomassariella vexata]